MDIYDFKNMGHSGFEHVKIVDVNSYSEFNCEDGTLYEGDIDDAPDCLDDLEITSIDVWYNKDANRIEATIDVDGADEDLYGELGLGKGGPDDGDDPDDGMPADGSEPQLATDDREAGQWLE